MVLINSTVWRTTERFSRVAAPFYILISKIDECSNFSACPPTSVTFLEGSWFFSYFLFGFSCFIFILLLWVFCMMYVCTSCARIAHGDQKRTLDSLGLEWQTTVSCHGGAGNQTSVSLEGQSSILAAEPSLQAYFWGYLCEGCFIVLFCFRRDLVLKPSNPGKLTV